MSEVVAKSQLECLDQDDYRKLVDQLVQMVVLSECEKADDPLNRVYTTYSFSRTADARLWSLPNHGKTGHIRLNFSFSGPTAIADFMKIFNDKLLDGVPHIEAAHQTVLVDFQYDREVDDQGNITASNGSFVINDRFVVSPESDDMEYLMDYVRAMASAISEYVGSLIAKEASKISGETRVAVRAASEL